MKKRKGISFLAIVLLVIAFLTYNSCRNTDDTVSCFPNSSINIQLNLNLPSYNNLLNVGGWIYVNEQSSGTKGLIVVRTSSGFMCYDRNAPHICPENNTTLNVIDNIKIVCPKDNSQWILLTGEPISGVQVPPKIYPYNISNNILTIYN